MCTDHEDTSFGIVKGSKTKKLPKENTKEVWELINIHFEPNTGMELCSLSKSYMSSEQNDVKENHEQCISKVDVDERTSLFQI